MLLDIHTIQDNGQPAVNRITDAFNAWNIYRQMWWSQQGQAVLRFYIKNLMDGNRPYDEAHLKGKGRGWESNVNFGEGRAIRDQRVLSYWKLMTDVPVLAQFFDKNNYMQSGNTDIDFTEAEGIIADEFTHVVRRWHDWTHTMLQALEEFVTYGIGPLIFQDEHDWRPKAMLSGNLLVPKFAKTSTDQLEVMMMRDFIAPHTLFEMIATKSNRERAKTLGWNPNVIEEALKFATQAVWNVDQTQTSTWESFSMSVKSNDYTMTSQVPVIRFVNILVREVDEPRKVSHYIIFEDQNLTDFMFQKKNAYDSIADMLHLFFYDNGGGYMRTVKGLGHRIYNHLELSNRMMNNIMNAGTLAGSMILKQDGDSGSAFAATRFGPFTIVPRNYNAIQQSFAPNLNSMGDLRQMIQSVLNNNEGVYKAQAEAMPHRKARSATEVRYEAMNDSRIEANQAEFFYVQLDKLYRMMFKRLVDKSLTGNKPGAKEAKEFRERCIERGVPEELLSYDRFIINASRAIGNGSPVMRDAISNDLVGLASSMPERGAYNAIRDRVAALVGYHMADRYMLPYTVEQNKDEHSSVAHLENNSMKQGMDALVAANQPHVPHIFEHMNLLMQYVQQAQANKLQDMAQAAHIIMMDLQHIDNHLQYLFRDTARQKVLKKILDQLKQIMPYLHQIQSAGQEQQKKQMQQQLAQQQKQGQNLTPEQQAAREKVKGDLQIKAQKVQADEKMKWAKLQSDIARKDRMVDATIAMNERKQLHEAGVAPIAPILPPVMENQVPQALPQPGVRP